MKLGERNRPNKQEQDSFSGGHKAPIESLALSACLESSVGVSGIFTPALL